MGLAFSRCSSLLRSDARLAAAVVALLAVLLKAKARRGGCLKSAAPASVPSEQTSPNQAPSSLPPRPTRAPPGSEAPASLPPRPTRTPPGSEAPASVPPRPTRPPPGSEESALLPPRPSRPPPPASTTKQAEQCSSVPPRLWPTPTRASAPASQSVSLDTSAVEIWVCLDFEWTCDDGPERVVHSDEGEIIEFSYAIYDAVARKAVGDGQHFCRNLRTPITQFCTDLTGITSEKLADAGLLSDALKGLEAVLSREDLAGRPCCAVAHGSADLELTLPRDCKVQGLAVPAALRRYVDLRVATQTHLANTGVRGMRASTLRQICEALHVDMIGEEHCGLDDAWMVLLCLQQLLEADAQLQAVDLDIERAAFLSGSCPDTQRLCLDSLPYFASELEVRPWVESLTEIQLQQDSLWNILGLDGRPSGRVLVDFHSHKAAAHALGRLDGGKRLTLGSFDTFPFEGPKERLLLARPLRQHEWGLLCETDEPSERGLAPLPRNSQAASLRLRSGQRQKPGVGCVGTVKNYNEGKGFGFITSTEGDVFFHRSGCPDGPPRTGEEVHYDVVEDKRTFKMKAVRVVRAQA